MPILTEKPPDIRPEPSRIPHKLQKAGSEIQKLTSGLSQIDNAFKAQIRQTTGEMKRELTDTYRLWKNRADIVGKDLAKGIHGALQEAKALIDGGLFILSSGAEKKRLEQNIAEVNRNIGGRAENKTFITNEYYSSISAVSKTVQAIKVYLQKPTKESAAAVGKELTDCSQQAKRTKTAEKYYEQTIELQTMHQVVISNSKNLILVINRQIEINSEMAQKGLIPLGEKQRVEGSLLERKKTLEKRIKELENRMKNYKLDDAIRQEKGQFFVNPNYGSLLAASENMVKNTAAYSIAISWQSLLAKEVNDYYEKGYWQRPAGDRARQESMKRIRLLIDAGKGILQAEINGLSKQPSLQSLKAGVRASIDKIEGAVFRGEAPVGKRAVLNMYLENMNADDAIAKANQLPDNRTWWEKYHVVVADVTVIGLGLLGTALSGGMASPFIAAAEATYFAGRTATDMTGNYLITKQLPGVLEVLGAAAMIFVPAARATKGLIALQRARALGAELRYTGLIRGSLKLGGKEVLVAGKEVLDIERRLAAELALEKAGGLKYLDTVSKVAGNYLMFSAVGGMIYDHSLENLLTNAVFFAMGAGHGITGKMRARAIKRIGPERLDAVKAEMARASAERMPQQIAPEFTRSDARQMAKIGLMPDVAAREFEGIRQKGFKGNFRDYLKARSALVEKYGGQNLRLALDNFTAASAQYKGNVGKFIKDADSVGRALKEMYARQGRSPPDSLIHAQSLDLLGKGLVKEEVITIINASKSDKDVYSSMQKATPPSVWEARIPTVRGSEVTAQVVEGLNAKLVKSEAKLEKLRKERDQAHMARDKGEFRKSPAYAELVRNTEAKAREVQLLKKQIESSNRIVKAKESLAKAKANSPEHAAANAELRNAQIAWDQMQRMTNIQDRVRGGRTGGAAAGEITARPETPQIAGQRLEAAKSRMNGALSDSALSELARSGNRRTGEAATVYRSIRESLEGTRTALSRELDPKRIADLKQRERLGNRDLQKAYTDLTAALAKDTALAKKAPEAKALHDAAVSLINARNRLEVAQRLAGKKPPTIAQVFAGGLREKGATTALRSDFFAVGALIERLKNAAIAVRQELKIRKEVMAAQGPEYRVTENDIVLARNANMEPRVAQIEYNSFRQNGFKGTFEDYLNSRILLFGEFGKDAFNQASKTFSALSANYKGKGEVLGFIHDQRLIFAELKKSHGGSIPDASATTIALEMLATGLPKDNILAVVRQTELPTLKNITPKEQAAGEREAVHSIPELEKMLDAAEAEKARIASIAGKRDLSAAEKAQYTKADIASSRIQPLIEVLKKIRDSEIAVQDAKAGLEKTSMKGWAHEDIVKVGNRVEGKIRRMTERGTQESKVLDSLPVEERYSYDYMKANRDLQSARKSFSDLRVYQAGKAAGEMEAKAPVVPKPAAQVEQRIKDAYAAVLKAQADEKNAGPGDRQAAANRLKSAEDFFQRLTNDESVLTALARSRLQDKVERILDSIKKETESQVKAEAAGKAAEMQAIAKPAEQKRASSEPPKTAAGKIGEKAAPFSPDEVKAREVAFRRAEKELRKSGIDPAKFDEIDTGRMSERQRAAAMNYEAARKRLAIAHPDVRIQDLSRIVKPKGIIGKVKAWREDRVAAAWQRDVQKAAKDLGISAKSEAASELAGLRRSSKGYAAVYEEALRKLGPEAGSHEAVILARKAVYDKAGVKLMPVDPELAQARGISSDLLLDKELFRMFANGGLMKKAALISGIKNPASVSITLEWGSTGAYRIEYLREPAKTALERAIKESKSGFDPEDIMPRIRRFFGSEPSFMAALAEDPSAAIKKLNMSLPPELRTSLIKSANDNSIKVFAKATSLETIAFAAKTFKGTDSAIPKVMSVSYKDPATRSRVEFGLMGDALKIPGIENSAFLKDLAKNPAMVKFLQKEENLRLFIRKLGGAFEHSRHRGVQDLKSTNIGIGITKEGDVKIIMIDLDPMAAYPRFESKTSVDILAYAYAGYVHDIARSISKATGMGQSRVLQFMGEEMIKGAEPAYMKESEPKMKRMMLALFRQHDGKPVGYGAGEENVRKFFKQFDKQGNPVTKFFMNGNLQQVLITKGPHAGKFIFNYKDALTYGYLEQMNTKPGDFWKAVIDLAPQVIFPGISY